MINIVVGRNSHITYFYWPIGPILTEQKCLKIEISRFMWREQIASANSEEFTNGI